MTVFERAKTLDGYAGTGLTLWPNGQKALAAIDAQLSEKLQTLGAATQHIEVTDASGENSLPNPTGDPRRFPDVYGFPMRRGPRLRGRGDAGWRPGRGDAGWRPGRGDDA